MVVDESGLVVWEADYEAFGGVDIGTQSFTNNFKFPGQYYDVETGFNYNYHRFYDPQIGRYLTPDPLGLVGGFNLYVYVQNNPINFIDPYGLEMSDILPGIRTALVEGAIGAAYATTQAANATADIAMNGHPLAQAALGVALFSEAAPLASAAAISSFSTFTATAYRIAPYSGAFVDFTYGLFSETAPPQGWGYLSSGGMFVYQNAKDLLTSNNSSPCWN
jgi:RHS repeat-associated protein